MSADHSISELDKIFSGEREGQLTEHDVYMLVNIETTSIIRYYLYQGLLKKAIDPKILLKSIVDKLLTDRPMCYDPGTRDQLAIFGFALRGAHRANPNIYITKKGFGAMHIIGYIFSSVASSKNINNIESYMMMLLILVFSGSNMSLRIYSDTGEHYREDRQDLFEVDRKNRTVREYLLNNNQHDLVITLDSFKENIKDFITSKKKDPNTKSNMSLITEDVIKSIGMYLDDPELMIGNYVDTFKLIRFQDLRILESNKLILKNHDLKEILRYSILLNSPETFKIAFRKLGNIDYIDFNILLIDTSSSKRYRYLQAQLRQCINFVIDSGTILDVYEVSLLQNIDPEFKNEVIERYSQPHWKKECSLLEGLPSQELKDLAYQLNIDITDDKNYICSKIKEISDADPTKLIEASINREKGKLSSFFSSITDYIDGEPSYQCRNKDLLTNDPFEYVDLDMAMYKDTRGSIWCFTKNSFEDLLNKKVNIYTNEALPEEFIRELEGKKSILQKLGVYGSSPKTISEGIAAMNAKDQVKTKDEIDTVISKFENILMKNNINVIHVRNLTPETMNILARSFEKPEINFNVFPQNQRYVVFAITLFDKFRHKPNDIKLFVEKYNNLVQKSMVTS